MLRLGCTDCTNRRPPDCTHLVALAIVACAGIACAEEERTYWTCLDPQVEKTEPPNIPLVHQTEHLDIYVDDGRFVCAGSAVDYERFVRYVAEELEMDISRRIPLYMVDDPWDYCPSPMGCTKRDGTAFAMPSATYHELTHGVACEIRVGSAPALSEGLAVSFEVTSNESMTDPRSFLTLPRAEFNPHYTEAGHFMRWLLEEFGPGALKSIYRGVPMTAGEEVALAMEDTLGMSLDSLSEDYLAHAPKNWLPHRQCADLAVLPSNGSSWVFETRFDCEDESTLGPYERLINILVWTIGAESMYQSFLIDVQTPGTHHVETSGASAIFFEKCMESGDQRWNQNVKFFSFVNSGTIELDSVGLWRIDVLADYGPATDVSITIAPQG